MGHYVYKYVYDGKIIYIGKNDTNLKNRIYQHTLEEKFYPYKDAKVYYIKLNNAIMSDVVESELVRRYKPILNVAKTSDWSGIDFVEPEWKLFIPEKVAKNKKTCKSSVVRSKLSSLTRKCHKLYEYERYMNSHKTAINIIIPMLINKVKKE